jgi:hypothetical protein
VTSPASWGEVRLTNTSFNLEQAATRFNGDFWLGDYEGLAAAGKDFVAVWGMPDGSATAQESIFFRRAISVSALQTASIGHNQAGSALPTQQVATPLPEAIYRWPAAGIDTSALAGIDLRSANLGGTPPGLASGHTITLDDNTPKGGAGGNRGYTHGGGVFIAGGSSRSVTGSPGTPTKAESGEGDGGGSDGQGLGGDVYTLGNYIVDAATVLRKSQASTSNDDLFP